MCFAPDLDPHLKSSLLNRSSQRTREVGRSTGDGFEFKTVQEASKGNEHVTDSHVVSHTDSSACVLFQSALISTIHGRSLTCSKTEVALGRFVEVIVDKSFGPETIWLLVFLGRVCDSPMVVSDDCTGWHRVAHIGIVFRQCMRYSNIRNAGSKSLSVHDSLFHRLW